MLAFERDFSIIKDDEDGDGLFKEQIQLHVSMSEAHDLTH